MKNIFKFITFFLILQFSILAVSAQDTEQFAQKNLSTVVLKINEQDSAKTFLGKIQTILNMKDVELVDVDFSDDFLQKLELKSMLIWLNSTMPVEFNYADYINSDDAQLKADIVIGNNVKKNLLPVLSQNKFSTLKTGNDKVFGYMFENEIKKVLVFGNLDLENEYEISVKIPKFDAKKQYILPIKISSMPYVKKRKLIVPLKAGAICVLIVSQAS